MKPAHRRNASIDAECGRAADSPRLSTARTFGPWPGEGRMSEPIANVDMAHAWDGEEGDQWTQFADEYDTNFRSIWAGFLEKDPIAPADRVLDIGCGSGQSTRDAARLARDGSALGVDLSESMLA